MACMLLLKILKFRFREKRKRNMMFAIGSEMVFPTHNGKCRFIVLVMTKDTRCISLPNFVTCAL